MLLLFRDSFGFKRVFFGIFIISRIMVAHNRIILLNELRFLNFKRIACISFLKVKSCVVTLKFLYQI